MRRTTLYILEVTITDGLMTKEVVTQNPVVSRTIELRADQTPNQLHRAIFLAFGRWDNCHLHEFHFGAGARDRHAQRYVLPFILTDPEDEPAAGSVTTTRMGRLELQVGSVFWYWYDFGDDWYHQIEVVAIGAAEPGVEYPGVTARVGESPPQYRDWDEDGEDEFGDDWVADVLDERYPDVGSIDTGTIPLDDGEVVVWTRRQIPADLSQFVRDEAAHQTYRVTTIADLTDGTSIIAIYLVPGQYLGVWLEELRQPSEEPETLLSVEVV